MIGKLCTKQFLKIPKDGAKTYSALRRLKLIEKSTLSHTEFHTHSMDYDQKLLPLVLVRYHSSNRTRNQKAVIENTSPRKIDIPDISFSKLSVWRRKIDPYLKLIRMDKPIGTWLLYWPCTWSIALASIKCGEPMPSVLYHMSLFYAGSFVMRGAGCTINDLWDRDVDGKVDRTKDRPLVSGAISERQALTFLAAQLSLGLTVLLQLNWLSVAVGASSMLLVVTYPLAKRITHYPQIVLGATFNWGAMVGYTAIANEFDPYVILPMYAAALCWTVVYDTIYAHQDKDDDARIGIKSTALKYGSNTNKYLAVWGLGSLAGCATLGWNACLDWPYYFALAAASAHVGRQIYTLDPNSPEDCATKFRSNSLVGFLLFLGICAGGFRQYNKNRENNSFKENCTQVL